MPELIRFRHVVDELYLRMLSSPDQVREMRKASEQIDLAIIDLHKCLNEKKIKTFFTSLSLYLNVSDSSLFTVLAGMYGANVSGFPLALGAAAGLGVNTILKFTTRCINKPSLVPNELKDFMYLYKVSEYWKNDKI